MVGCFSTIIMYTLCAVQQVLLWITMPINQQQNSPWPPFLPRSLTYIETTYYIMGRLNLTSHPSCDPYPASQIMPPCISMIVFLTLYGLYCSGIVSVCLSGTCFDHHCVYGAVRSAGGFYFSFLSSNSSYFFFPLLAIVVAMWSVVSSVHIQDYSFWFISCILTSFFLHLTIL